MTPFSLAIKAAFSYEDNPITQVLRKKSVEKQKLHGSIPCYIAREAKSNHR